MTYNRTMNLPQYLSAHGIQQAAFAQTVNCDRGHINHICAGRARPSPALALRIEAATNGEVPRGTLRPDVYPPAATNQAA